MKLSENALHGMAHRPGEFLGCGTREVTPAHVRLEAIPAAYPNLEPWVTFTEHRMCILSTCGSRNQA